MSNKNYRVVSELPQEGQFVAVWMFNDKLWSSVYRYGENGVLLEYMPDEDNFSDKHFFFNFLEDKINIIDFIFYIVEDK